MNSGIFPWENKHDSHRTFVSECPREKFMNWPFFSLVAGVAFLVKAGGIWNIRAIDPGPPER